MAEFLFGLQWVLTFFLIGIIFLPLSNLVFEKFFDRGYLFSKVLGIGIISYAILVLNIFHILPFGVISLLLVLWLCLIGNFLVLKKIDIRKIKPYLKIFLLEELLFLVGIAFWSYVRGHEPSINGLEKFMDFGFINSILRTTWQPAVDMWFPPHAINYYYFGHLTTAVLTKASFVPSFISYNLMIATLFSFTFSLSFSLGANLLLRFLSFKKALAGGLLIGLLVALSGNLHTIYSFFTAYNVDNPVPFWNLLFSPNTFPNGYWYPNATRFIPFTIHEFPIYSFVVSDLHGHVIDIIFVLTTIAMLYALLISKHESRNSKRYLNLNVLNIKPFKNWNLFRVSGFGFRILLQGLFLAIMYMTNAWDGLIYMLLSAFLLIYLKKYKEIIIVFFFFIIFAIPFSLNFKPFASGIGVLCAPSFLTKIGKIGPLLFEADHCQKSAWWQLLTLYGFFYFFVISFIVFLFKPSNILKKLIPIKFGLPKIERTDIFILLLIFLSTLLIIVPEIIYLKDIYPAHYRANTMFKLVYQSFIMLSISSGYIIIRIASAIKPRVPKIFNIYYVFLLFTILFLILVMIYPYFAVKAYYADLKKYKSLDGIAYMKQRLPDDYNAILWINRNIKGKPIIVEAQGDSYTDYARISSNTGLPTILGWTVHEWLWRGSYEIPAPRIEEVRLIYESPDLNIVKRLLDKYEARYIYIGNLELEKYKNIDETRFLKIGKVIFKSGNSTIYELF